MPRAIVCIQKVHFILPLPSFLHLIDTVWFYIYRVDDVVKGFMELVNDESKDGEVLTVTTKGLAYVTAQHNQVFVEPKL